MRPSSPYSKDQRTAPTYEGTRVITARRVHWCDMCMCRIIFLNIFPVAAMMVPTTASNTIKVINLNSNISLDLLIVIVSASS